jgi:hypothetical protein
MGVKSGKTWGGSPSGKGPMAKNRSLVADIWGFLKVRKAWWLTPILVMLGLMGLLIVAGQSGVIAPFIYALF